jgi:hypothetical protein
VTSDTGGLAGAVAGGRHESFAGIEVDAFDAGDARVKRLVYPVGMRWSTDVRPKVGTEHCMHAHLGFLAQGQLHFEYADGCRADFRAPQFVAVEAGHDAWVVGDEPAVLIQFDFGADTPTRLALPSQHDHR